MGTQDFEVTGTTDATPEAVWRLLGDSATWPTWTSIDRHRPERAAGPDGTGEIRVFHSGRYTLREEIVESVPPRRLTYTVLSGLAVRDYRAEIDLAERADGGTDVRWHTRFRTKVPGMGVFYRKALLRSTETFVAGLTAAARTHDAQGGTR
jgi:uncharacterized protein YndB with AHSA1/START domain